jgi:N-acetylglucosaminyl-diphospho-decaprenol L-rhamnosyltransferase
MDAHALQEEMGAAATPALTDTAAVIVTHDRAELARDCAERIREEIDPRSIVVVVNDPENAPADALESLSVHAGVVVLNESPRGYGANLNEGVRRLRGRYRYYFLANDDVLPELGTIRALRNALESDPVAAVAGPRLVDVGGRRQPGAYRYPSLGSEVAAALIVPASLQRRLWRRFVLGVSDRVESRTSDVWLVGAALLVRASAFHEIDGFDEQFFLYAEETDLSFRMRERGWFVRRCEGVAVVHRGGESTSDRRYRRMMGVSRQKYILKHWSLPERIALRALFALAYSWNSVYVLVRILLQPRSWRAKLSLWAAHWETRPRSRPRAQRSSGRA